MPSGPSIGVLALQGAVREHAACLSKAGAKPVPVKRTGQLEVLDGLIIPGGESTTIGKLMVKYGFIEAVKDFARQGKPVYGTCAGLIIVAKRVYEGTPPWLELMDIEARRNAFGRQQESFEAPLEIAGFDKPFTGVFIRAPWIEEAGPKVTVLAEYDGRIVMAEEQNILVTAFHPELTEDTRIHEYFIDMIKNSG
ncbi:MAG: pyridoxal 5'-phosphate synthase glutaminase subunit PdxT [Actinomycetota bacterium]